MQVQSISGSSQNQLVPVDFGQRDQCAGRQQIHSHSIQKLEADQAAARLVGRKFKNCHGMGIKKKLQASSRFTRPRKINFEEA